jgi:hypothetical protein
MRILDFFQDAFRRPSLLVSSSDHSCDRLRPDLTRRISSSYFSPGITIKHHSLPLWRPRYHPGELESLSLRDEHRGERLKRGEIKSQNASTSLSGRVECEESSITDESEGITNPEIDKMNSRGGKDLSEDIHQNLVINSDLHDAKLANTNGGRQV